METFIRVWKITILLDYLLQDQSTNNICHFLSVGLSRYSSHAVPACDRKEFLLNFNGITSLHASSGGSYYHQLHHRHQSVYQDVKPCVMWQQRRQIEPHPGGFQHFWDSFPYKPRHFNTFIPPVEIRLFAWLHQTLSPYRGAWINKLYPANFLSWNLWNCCRFSV